MMIMMMSEDNREDDDAHDHLRIPYLKPFEMSRDSTSKVAQIGFPYHFHMDFILIFKQICDLDIDFET